MQFRFHIAEKRRSPGRWLAAGILLSGSILAQTPEEHLSHHPAATGASSPTPTQIPNTTVPGTAPPGAFEMMGEMMRQMGVPPRKELYPALMALEEVTSEQRSELERLARERMSAGTALLSSGLERLSEAASANALGAMQEASAQMRQGVVQYESGIAALRAVSESQPPQQVALSWFRQNMNLLPSPEPPAPHGILGLSVVHYLTMLLLIAFAAATIWLNLRKLQRAQALATRLAGTGQELATAAKLDSPAVPSPALPTSAEAPSKPNSWSGLLRVVRIFEETPNVRTLRLADPAGTGVPFRHLPGQFITFTVSPNDQAVKRSYTIASSPTRRDYVEVTVKREARGTVSSFLHGVHEGDSLHTTGPSGNFTFVGDGANSIVFISGGVGVTPMMSMLRYLTDRSWRGDIFFIYGCRGEHDVIYREELEYLQKRFPNLHLTIAADIVESADWPYARGPITQELLLARVPHVSNRRVHLCGPKPMMDAIKSMLAELGVPAEQIRTEVFIGKERPAELANGAPAAGALPTEAGMDPGETVGVNASVGVAVTTFARSKRTALLPAGKTVLEASEDVGVNIDYSCRVGTCGVCRVKLLAGSVTMEVEDGLDPSDKQNQIILACQAKSTGDLTVDA